MAEIILYGDAWPQRIPIGGSGGEVVQTVLAESMLFPASIAFAGAQVGMRVVGVVGTVAAGPPYNFVDQSSEFESTISVAGAIQQIAAPSNAGIVFITLQAT
jgi:hypothetical protein